MFQLKSVELLSGAVVISLSSILLLTPKRQIWVVPLLHSVSDLRRKQVCPNVWEDLPKKIPCSDTPEAKVLNCSTFLLEFLFHKKATY